MESTRGAIYFLGTYFAMLTSEGWKFMLCIKTLVIENKNSYWFYENFDFKFSLEYPPDTTGPVFFLTFCRCSAETPYVDFPYTYVTATFGSCLRIVFDIINCEPYYNILLIFWRNFIWYSFPFRNSESNFFYIGIVQYLRLCDILMPPQIPNL